MNFYLTNKLIVENPTHEMKAYCKSTLSFPNPEFIKKQMLDKWVGNIPREIVLYEQSGNVLYLPFGVANDVYKRFNKYFADCRSLIKPKRAREYKSSIQTYSYQERGVQASLRAKNGILVAPCGSGKTQMGLEVVSRIGGKALWITHTLDLLNQSMERAKACFGLPLNEYGTVTGGKVNIGNTITFATVQTMANIDLSQYRDEWDVIIVDECHKCVGTPTQMMMFYKVLSSLSARYKIGLTATPYRADGLSRSMFAILGDVIYEVSRQDVADKTCQVKVKFVETGFEPDLDAVLDSDGTIIYSQLIENITKDDKRNEKIVDEIIKASRDGGVLVLSDRIIHLEILNKKVAQVGILSQRLGTANTQKEKEERKVALRKLNDGELNVVFATYKLAKEGLDVPNLRTVIFATPQKDKTTVIQSAGRVARKAQGKEFGTVVDFTDNFGMLKRYERERKKYYKTLSYIY